MKANILFVAAILLALPTALFAAGGLLHGKITAGANATPIPNARVVLHGGSRDEITKSNEEGNYEFSSVDPGQSYSLLVEGDGLQPASKSDIHLAENRDQQVDLNLQLADIRTTVLVTAGVINLEAASAEISQTIDSTEIKNLPSVTRSATKYALLDPHVRQPLGLGADYQDANRISINAASYRHTSYMLDGTTNYDWVYANNPQATVAPASVQDVKVLSGDYSAQYGNSTNGIIAITTSSGGNEHHGELFSYIRPSGIQAPPERGQGTPESMPHHIPNQKLDWGGSVGGPLVKGRTFYFASYERVQQNRGSVINVPEQTFFNGNSSEYSGLFRIDHNLTNKNTISGRFNGWHYATNDANDRIAAGNQPSFGRTARIQSWGGQISDQAVIGNAVNIARFAYTNYFPDSATPLDASVGVVIDSYAPKYQAGYSTYSWVHAQTETFGDLLALRKGRHDLKFGGELVHLHVRDFSLSPYGTYFFSTADRFANGSPYKYTQTFGAADVRYGQKELSAFVQDDIRLSSRLTANLGVRYEYQSITDSMHNFGPRVGLAWDPRGDGKTIVRAGGGVFFDQYYMYLNRRFITLGPKSPQFNYTWDCEKSPGSCPVYPTPSAPPTGGTQSPFVSYLYVPAAKLLNPYSYQVSASVEHEIARGTVFTLSGLHTHTLQQMRVNDINHPVPFVRTIPGQSRSIADANSSRPLHTFDGVDNVTLVDQIENTASSLYQSFDASIRHRFTRWGEVRGHYVFSGSYAYAMFYADYNSGVPNDWLPNWDRYERGPSDFYQRHRFIADAVLYGPYKTTLSLVGNFGSGLPVNPLTGKDNNGDGYNVDRPVGLGRNSYRTPAQKTVDVAVAKQFPLHERFRAETRIEALNVFNSKNFVNVNNKYGDGATPLDTFLTPLPGITNTDPSRQLQFVVRLLF